MTSFQVICLFAFAGFLLYAIFQSIKLKAFTIKLFVSLLIIGLGFLFSPLWYIGLLLIITDLIVFSKQSGNYNNYFEKLNAENRNIYEEHQRKIEEQKNSYFSRNNIPDSIRKVTYLYGHPDMDNASMQGKDIYIWHNSQNIIFLYITETEVIKYELLINDIIQFDIFGQIHNKVNIEASGGGGGGSSIGGAIVGGLIAGEVGAIIGSRKETKPIEFKTTNTYIDTRKTFIHMKYNNEIKIFLDSSAYNKLLKLIPEKEAKFINTTYQNNIISQSNDNLVFEQIKKLSELRNDDIITEEEFAEKKKSFWKKYKNS